MTGKEKSKNLWKSSNGQWGLLIAVLLIFKWLGILEGWNWAWAFLTGFVVWRILMILTGGDKDEIEDEDQV